MRRRPLPIHAVAIVGTVTVFALLGPSPGVAGSSPPSPGGRTSSAASRMPSFVGMPLPKAERLIRAKHLGYGVQESPSSAPAGTVIFQTPRAGSTVAVSKTGVSLTVAFHYHTTATVPVESCSVGAPFAGQPQLPLARAPVDLGPRSGRKWRVYGYPGLVAPQGWSCSGFIAEDGGNTFAAVPHGERTPSLDTGLDLVQPATSRISIYGEPACSSCKWDMACALFDLPPQWPGEECPHPPAAGEVDRRIGKNVVDFTDPPGVAGTGQPSGGAEPAVGAVVYKDGAAMITCILPASTHTVCSSAVRAFTTYELALSDPGQVSVRINHERHPT
jgi:hypothetical protein